MIYKGTFKTTVDQLIRYFKAGNIMDENGRIIDHKKWSEIWDKGGNAITHPGKIPITIMDKNVGFNGDTIYLTDPAYKVQTVIVEGEKDKDCFRVNRMKQK